MPTVEEVIKIRDNRLKRVYPELRRQNEDALKMYNGDFHVLAPGIRKDEKFHEVLPVTSRLLVESVTAHCRPSKVSVHFEALKETKREKEHADKLEELGNAYVRRWGATKALSPFSETGKNVSIYGWSGLRTLCDMKSWGNPPVRRPGETEEDFEYREALWEAQRSTTLPFVISAIDPLNMLPPPGVDKPYDMIEYYKVQPFALLRDFPNYIPPKGSDGNSDLFADVALTTYWDAQTWMYITDEKKPAQQLRRYPFNPYGIVPYTLVWGGFGKNSPTGKPEQRAVGLIYPLVGLLKEEARSLTAVSIILQAAALGRPWVKGAPEGGIQVGIAPGDVTDLGVDGEIGWWPNPPVSSDLYSIMQIAGQQIERMVGEKILAGVRPTGVTSALFEEILLEQAKRRYLTFIESMENGYANVISQCLYLHENVVRQRLPGTRIKPDEIRGYYSPEVKFEYADIAEKRIKAMIASMLFMRGLIDFETAHSKEYMNTADVSGIRRGLIEDQLYKDPTLIAGLAMELAEDMGFAQMMRQVAERRTAETRIETRGEIRQPTKQEKAAFSELLPPEEESVEMPGYAGGGFGYGEGEALEVA